MLIWVNFKAVLSGIVYLLLCYAIAISHRDSLQVQGLFFLFFAVYIYLFRNGFSSNILWIIALLCRIVLSVNLPNLSDDFYRFFWDGYITMQGYSPYQFVPSILASELPHSILPEVYPYLNSPQYYSVYTPLNQVLYAIPFLFGVDNVSVVQFVFTYRILFFLIEGLFVYLLFKKFSKKQKYLLLFVLLNPLYVIESYGNLHIEFLMGLSLLLALTTVTRWKGRFWLIITTSLKLITLVVAPFLLWAKEKSLVKNTLHFALFGALFLILNGLPFLNGNEGFFKSLDLYFQYFEFNASIYFVARALGEIAIGYNAIALIGGVILPLVFLGIYLLVFVRIIKEKTTLYPALVIIMVCYYLLSTTVHPWYIIVPFCLFVFKPNFTCLVWSFTVFFSYQFYNTDTNFLFWNIAEYVLVLIAILIDFRGTRMELDNGRLKIVSV